MKRATPTHDSHRRTRARIAENSGGPTGTLIHALFGHTGRVNAMAIMSNNMIVSGSDDSSMRVWDTKSGTCLLTLVGHTQAVRFLAVLDNDTLASGSDDLTVCIWDPRQVQKQVRCIVDMLLAYTMLEKDVCNIIAEYSRDTEGTPLLTLDRHTNDTPGTASQLSGLVTISPNKLASCTDFGTVHVWNQVNGERLYTIEQEYGTSSMTVLPEGKLALCTDDGEVSVFNSNNGDRLITLEGHIPFEASADLHPVVALDGEKIAWHDLCLYNINISHVTSGALLHTLEGHRDIVTDMVKLSSSKLASSSNDSTVRIWNIDSRSCLLVLRHTHVVLNLAVFPTGELASGSLDGMVRVWDTTTGECLHVFVYPSLVTTLTVLPDGKLVSGYGDGSICVFE